MVIIAIDNKVALLAIVFRLRLREEHLTELKKGHLVARPAGTACGELPGLKVFVIQHILLELLLLDVFAAEDNQGKERSAISGDTLHNSHLISIERVLDENLLELRGSDN